MGLGKTLSILSAIVYTLDEACKSGFVPSKYISMDKDALATRATLVVVPSARMSAQMRTIANTDLYRIDRGLEIGN